MQVLWNQEFVLESKVDLEHEKILNKAEGAQEVSKTM